jgi:hypothetical protein
MQSLTINEVEAMLAKRRVKMTRWDWLRESVPYAYFWKDTARDAIVPALGVFVACVWVGWVEKSALKTGGV